MSRRTFDEACLKKVRMHGIGTRPQERLTERKSCRQIGVIETSKARLLLKVLCNRLGGATRPVCASHNIRFVVPISRTIV